MKTLHILDHSIPLHSGYTFRTANLLKGQRALGWETHHLTSPKQGHCAQSVEEIDGLVFNRTPVPSLSAPVLGEVAQMRATEARLLQLAQALRPDILHAHSPVLNALPAIKVGRRLGIPVVYEVRAFWEDAAVDHGTTSEGSLRYRLTRALESHALRQVDHVFTICEGLRKDIVGRGIPADKITVIPNAVNVESFQMSGVPDPGLKADLGLDGCEVIGFIGSFYAYEGLDLLLEAFAQLLRSRPAARVLLVGGGPQEANLKRQAESLGVSDKVVFTGRVPHGEVQRYYDLVDVLAYPRHSMRLTELVTPLKPLEAMAQGRIFVASDVGGHKELIRDGETGVLFPAGNATALSSAIDALFERREDWQTMRQAGRRYVEDIRNWTNSVANYVPVYGALAGKGV
jgi:PEP-CTERM/exosortase A-associated glycosyltransferase